GLDVEDQERSHHRHSCRPGQATGTKAARQDGAQERLIRAGNPGNPATRDDVLRHTRGGRSLQKRVRSGGRAKGQERRRLGSRGWVDTIVVDITLPPEYAD